MKVLKYTVGDQTFSTAASSSFMGKYGTELEALNALAITVIPDGVSYEIIDHTDIEKPAPTADEVRAEASRRMVLLFGARDAAHLNILVSNATREAVKLLRKGPGNWDETEAARAAQLEAAENALDYVRVKSNLLEVMNPIPQNYMDDSYWT